MVEYCIKCGITRPTYIADAACNKGGYHHWERIDPQIQQRRVSESDNPQQVSEIPGFGQFGTSMPEGPNSTYRNPYPLELHPSKVLENNLAWMYDLARKRVKGQFEKADSHTKAQCPNCSLFAMAGRAIGSLFRDPTAKKPPPPVCNCKEPRAKLAAQEKDQMEKLGKIFLEMQKLIK